MRSKVLAMLSLAFGCGGCADSGSELGTLTLTTYRVSGPVNTQLVAVQNGDGAWTAVTGNAGVYTVTLHSEHFGFTVACSTDTFSSVYTIYAAISDGLDWYVDDCNDPPAANAMVTGTVTGAGAADPLRVMNGFGFVDVAAGATTYNLPTSVGPTRMFAEELVNNRPIKIVAVDTTVADGGTVDFNLANGFAPVTHALTANTAIASQTLAYRDSHTIAILDRSTTGDYRGIPADQLGNGLNRLSVVAPTTDTTSQFVVRYFKAPIDQAITLTPVPELAHPPTATAKPYPTASVTVPVRSGATSYAIDFSTTNQATMFFHDWSAQLTAAYLEKAFPTGTIAYAMPDYHALPGWQTAFQLEAGLPIDWFVQDNTYVNVDNFNAIPPDQFAFHDGGEEQISTTNGEIAAP